MKKKNDINNNVNNVKKADGVHERSMELRFNSSKNISLAYLPSLPRVFLNDGSFKNLSMNNKKTTILHKLCDSYIRLNFGRRFSGRNYGLLCKWII